MGREPQPRPTADSPELEDATTQADDDWPVAPQYQVAPEPDLGDALEDDRGAVAIGAPPRRWLGIPAAAVVALVALLVLAAASAGWLLTRPDGTSAGATPVRPHTTPPTPSGSSGPPKASTTTPATKASTTSPTTTTTTAPAPPTIATPDVVGLSASTAARRLRAAKLEPSIRLVPSSRDAGTVLAQRPGRGAEVDVGARVELRVAKNVTPAKVSVPGLVQLDAAGAKARLRSLGLHWSVTTRPSDGARGTVLAQAPPPGSRVARGATIHLTVSSGPAQISVPDVTGLDAASARAQLDDAGFDVSVVDQPTSDQTQDGMVVDQSPAAGSTAPKGSTVTITVARFD